VRACRTCMLPLVARQDDGTGAHKECPPQPDRERYLKWKHDKDPGKVAWDQALAEERKPWEKE
jgi:hypothetical protein